MNDIDYGERVTLLRPQYEPQEMSLAEAVRAVMSWPDVRDRMAATIVGEGKPLLILSQIEAVYSRPDFPNSN